jgi:3',5'-cyclic AMP phosphodiesterase CpdA
MKLAHFSDVHINGRAGASRFCRLIDHAIANGAEHLLIGGDLVDRGNVKDARPVRDHIRRRGFLYPDKLSIVPGNHDIWPVAWSALHDTDELGSVLTHKAYAWATDAHDPAQENLEELLELFSAAYEGAETYYGDLVLPCVKQVGPVRIGMLDTTSNSVATHAQGRFDAAEGEWLVGALREFEGPSILLMHHWPYRWSSADANDLPLAIRLLMKMAGLSPAAFCSVNFRNLPAVQRFIKTGGFDAVLCGHMHEGDKDTLGHSTVYCMGRSSGEDGTYAYDLFTATSRSIRGRTIHVDAEELG